MGKKDAHSADDWVKAAFRTLSRDGLAGVRVEAIARGLKVSKGSFYWHFADVPALKATMLDHWAEQSTFALIGRVKSSGGTAAEKLRMVVDIATDNGSAEYGGLDAEPAVRQWARFDEQAARTLRRVDMARLAFVAELFDAAGATGDSTERAELLYGALIGLESLEREGLSDTRARLHTLLDLLI